MPRCPVSKLGGRSAKYAKIQKHSMAEKQSIMYRWEFAFICVAVWPPAADSVTHRTAPAVVRVWCPFFLNHRKASSISPTSKQPAKTVKNKYRNDHKTSQRGKKQKGEKCHWSVRTNLPQIHVVLSRAGFVVLVLGRKCHFANSDSKVFGFFYIQKSGHRCLKVWVTPERDLCLSWSAAETWELTGVTRFSQRSSQQPVSP